MFVNSSAILPNYAVSVANIFQFAKKIYKFTRKFENSANRPENKYIYNAHTFIQPKLRATLLPVPLIRDTFAIDDNFLTCF